jgi:hypothetical protein
MFSLSTLTGGFHMSQIPGIDRKLTKRQREVAADRIDEVPAFFRTAVRTAIRTGYLPQSTANLIRANAGNALGAQVIGELQNL